MQKLPPPSQVYPNDQSLDDRTAATRGTFLFEIEADADPDVWVRVAQIFNVANVAPAEVTLKRSSTDRVRIVVAMQNIGAPMAELIRRKLGQLTSIRGVTLHARGADE
jgi:hypothetical protein